MVTARRQPVRAGVVVYVAAFTLFIGCTERVSIRTYDEVIVLPSPVESLFEGSSEAVVSPYAWSVPDGWQAFAGDGIRHATFEVTSDGATAQTTIVSLEGDAGGARANVVRWLEQIGMTLTANELDQLLAAAPVIEAVSGDGFQLYDLTDLEPSAAESTTGAIGRIGTQTVFIKMTGKAELLRRVRPSFEALVRSITQR